MLKKLRSSVITALAALAMAYAGIPLLQDTVSARRGESCGSGDSCCQYKVNCTGTEKECCDIDPNCSENCAHECKSKC